MTRATESLAAIMNNLDALANERDRLKSDRDRLAREVQGLRAELKEARSVPWPLATWMLTISAATGWLGNEIGRLIYITWIAN